MVLLNGCQSDRDRYELKRDNVGRSIRLDKRTGDAWLLRGDKWEKIETHSAVPVKEESQVEPKRWDPVSWPEHGIDSITLTTFRNHIKLRIYPIPMSWPGRLGYDYFDGPFELFFYDSEGVEYASKVVSSYKRIVDVSGDVIGLAAEDACVGLDKAVRWKINYRPK